VPHIPKTVTDAFLKHTWPGNIRELRNAVERCFILGQGKTFSLEWLDGAFALDKPLKKSLFRDSTPNFTQASRDAKREKLQEVLARNGENKAAAARELGVTRKTIYNWLRS
jgi:transcriptional regulator with PAS, ATPase and Fis domain